MAITLGEAVPVSEIQINGDASGVRAPVMDKDGNLTITADDGDTVVRIGSGADDDDEEYQEDPFYENLAETLEGGKLAMVAEQLLTDIAADEQSREGWLENRNKGLSLLGLELPGAKSMAANGAQQSEGISTVIAPLLLGEVIKSQATARGELLPAAGPVKIEDESAMGADGQRDFLADALQKDMNTYLTRVATEYYPDTDRMLFYTALGGSGFKKIYRCPLRKRPVSESVDAADLILAAGATDLANCRRKTHRIPMRESMVKRMIIVGAYRKIELGQANEQPSESAVKQGDIVGIDVRPKQPMDSNRTIYECACELDLGEGDDDMPLPYLVVIDKDSRQILSVRRHWHKGDELYMERKLYVRYPYIDAVSIYCIGLLHLIGNNTKALTAIERILIDSGMFSSFPGFLYAGNASRQQSMDIRVAPGTGMKIETNGRPIQESVMNLPYKEPSSTLMQLAQWLEGNSKELAGSAEIKVGEGQQNMPVGTMLAMIDQATKPTSAVHARLHAAQAEEFQLLVDLFRDDPEAFWRHGRRGIYEWDKELFIHALDSFELVPVADPNAPTRMHRLMKAQALKMLSQSRPGAYDDDAVDSHILRLLGFSNPQAFFAPKSNQPPPPSPAEIAARVKLQEAQIRAQTSTDDNQIKLVTEKIRAASQKAALQNDQQIEAGHQKFERTKLGAEMQQAALEGLAATREHVHDSKIIPPMPRPAEPGGTGASQPKASRRRSPPQ